MAGNAIQYGGAQLMHVIVFTDVILGIYARTIYSGAVLFTSLKLGLNNSSCAQKMWISLEVYVFCTYSEKFGLDELLDLAVRWICSVFSRIGLSEFLSDIRSYFGRYCSLRMINQTCIF